MTTLQEIVKEINRLEIRLEDLYKQTDYLEKEEFLIKYEEIYEEQFYFYKRICILHNEMYEDITNHCDTVNERLELIHDFKEAENHINTLKDHFESGIKYYLSETYKKECGFYINTRFLYMSEEDLNRSKENSSHERTKHNIRNCSSDSRLSRFNFRY